MRPVTPELGGTVDVVEEVLPPVGDEGDRPQAAATISRARETPETGRRSEQRWVGLGLAERLRQNMRSEYRPILALRTEIGAPATRRRRRRGRQGLPSAALGAQLPLEWM